MTIMRALTFTIAGLFQFSPFIGIALLLLGLLWFAHPYWLQRAGI